jgi:hypothetical protein
MIYCGIDNGSTGTIGIINEDKVFFVLTPCKKVLDYQKKAKHITRIDYPALYDFLSLYPPLGIKFFIERPIKNPGLFEASASGLRAFEATLICLEQLNYSYSVVDSKQWQKKMLPEGIKGSAELKKASVDVGCRSFPQFAEVICKHKDADGLLIAEWARREKL